MSELRNGALWRLELIAAELRDRAQFIDALARKLADKETCTEAEFGAAARRTRAAAHGDYLNNHGSMPHRDIQAWLDASAAD